MKDEKWSKIDEEEIPEMVELLMRSNVDIDEICNETILRPFDAKTIKSHYYAFVSKLFKNEKERFVRYFKDQVFEIIQREHPCGVEELTYLTDSIRQQMPIAYMISTDDFLDIWDWKYREPNTQLEMTFGEWAELYSKCDKQND